jgi:hypothetical protein
MNVLTKSVGYAMLAMVRRCLRREREEGRKVDVSVLRVRRARLTIVTATMNCYFFWFYEVFVVCFFFGPDGRPTLGTLSSFLPLRVVSDIYTRMVHRKTKGSLLDVRMYEHNHNDDMADGRTPFVEGENYRPEVEFPSPACD